MRRLVGTSIAISAALAGAVGTVIPFYDGLSVLERERRYDMFVLLLCAAILVLGGLELARSSQSTRQPLLAASAALFGVTSYWLVEATANTGAGQWLYAAAAIGGAGAAVLLVLEELVPQAVATGPAPATPIAATLASAPAPTMSAMAPPPASPMAAPVVRAAPPVTTEAAGTAPNGIATVAPPPVEPVTPSGWYANPDGSDTERYWDAHLRQWTDLVRKP